VITNLASRFRYEKEKGKRLVFAGNALEFALKKADFPKER